jgi:hypothetical protein
MNTYYNYQLYGQLPTPTQKRFCDAFEDPAQVSRYFYILGLYLMQHFTIVMDLMDVPEFSEFVFGGFTANQNCISAITQMRTFWSNRPSFDARFSALLALFKCEGHRARHQFLYLLAPICRLCTDREGVPDELVLRCANLLSEVTRSVDGFLSSGFSAIRTVTTLLTPARSKKASSSRVYKQPVELAILTAGLVRQMKVLYMKHFCDRATPDIL